MSYGGLDGYPLEIALTAANSAAQAWYGYDQVRFDNKTYHLSQITRS